MSKTLSVRLPADLEAWLEAKAEETGVPKGRIVREQLERARANENLPDFFNLAGSVDGHPDLSAKRGFQR